MKKLNATYYQFRRKIIQFLLFFITVNRTSNLMPLCLVNNRILDFIMFYCVTCNFRENQENEYPVGLVAPFAKFILVQN